MAQVYLNGRFVSGDEAKISVYDHALVYGDGFFDSMAVCQGRVLHLDAHLKRFASSARMMRIPLPASLDEIRDLLLETASRNGLRTAPAGHIRPIVTRGVGLWVDSSADIGPPTFVIMSDEMPDHLTGPADVVSAVTSTYTRPGPSSAEIRIKSINYITTILAFLEARDRGAQVAILRDAAGYVAEGHNSNLFCVRDGELLCPPASSGLEGITRAGVLEAARSQGYRVREQPMTSYDVRCADEVFVTNSGAGIRALGRIDGDEMPAPVPGPMTVTLRGTYIEQALDSGTPVP